MLPVSAATACDGDDDEIPDEMDLDYAVSAADRARDLMTRHAVPPTPDNFAVWFQYVLATDEDFNRTIDIVISNKRKFDKRINCGLVQAVRKLQGQERAVASMVTERLSSVLSQATSYLAKAAADNRAHAQELGGLGSRSELGDNPMTIIGALATELSKAALRATRLETQFATTSKELEQVRNSLKVAQHCAHTDALTGLANRRALDEYLRAAQTNAMESGDALSVMLVDIDNFKRFNDGFGHQLGDHVLRLIAGVLKKGLRQEDFPARYGGEELLVVLPGASLPAARDVADRIRTTIAERNIIRRSTGTTLAKVTVSIGLAQYALGETVAELFERCDHALYLAKQSGRNCVRTEQHLDEEIVVDDLAAAP
jgi:diguanylate cyclase